MNSHVNSGAQTTRHTFTPFDFHSFQLWEWILGLGRVARSQSYHWLELHHPEGAASPYKTLLKQDLQRGHGACQLLEPMASMVEEKMYKTMEPFEASFQIRGIQAGNGVY